MSRGSSPGLLNDPSTTVMLVRDGLVAVPRGQGVLAARESVSMRLASLPGSYAAEALAGAPEAVAMFPAAIRAGATRTSSPST